MLKELRETVKDIIKDLYLPVRPDRAERKKQTGVIDGDGTDQPYDVDKYPVERPANVYLMRLPEQEAGNVVKYSPYILIQLVQTEEGQREGKKEFCKRALRFIFSVYGENGEEASLSLLNLIDRLKTKFLRERVIAKKYVVTSIIRRGNEDDMEAMIETFIYPDDVGPYYMGEMTVTLDCPPIIREVDYN
jgi:hypothetical protein